MHIRDQDVIVPNAYFCCVQQTSDKLLPVTSAFIDIICMELGMQRLDSEAMVDKIVLLAFVF